MSPNAAETVWSATRAMSVESSAASATLDAAVGPWLTIAMPTSDVAKAGARSVTW